LDSAPRHGAECAFVGAGGLASDLSELATRGSQRVSKKVDPDRERAFIGHRRCRSRKPTIVRLPSTPACQRSACRCRPPRRSLISAVQPSLHAAASDLGRFTTTSMIRTPWASGRSRPRGSAPSGSSPATHASVPVTGQRRQLDHAPVPLGGEPARYPGAFSEVVVVRMGAVGLDVVAGGRRRSAEYLHPAVRLHHDSNSSQ